MDPPATPASRGAREEEDAGGCGLAGAWGAQVPPSGRAPSGEPRSQCLWGGRCGESLSV